MSRPLNQPYLYRVLLLFQLSVLIGVTTYLILIGVIIFDRNHEEIAPYFPLIGTVLICIATIPFLYNWILTSRKQSEEDELKRNSIIDFLQSQNARLAELRNAVDSYTMVAFTDNKGIVTNANDKFCSFVGFSPEELQIQKYHLISSDANSIELCNEVWSVTENGKPWIGEICHRIRKGELC